MLLDGAGCTAQCITLRIVGHGVNEEIDAAGMRVRAAHYRQVQHRVLVIGLGVQAPDVVGVHAQEEARQLDVATGDGAAGGAGARRGGAMPALACAQWEGARTHAPMQRQHLAAPQCALALVEEKLKLEMQPTDR